MQAATTIQSFSVRWTPQGRVVAEANASREARLGATALASLLAHTSAGDGQI